MRMVKDKGAQMFIDKVEEEARQRMLAGGGEPSALWLDAIPDEKIRKVASAMLALQEAEKDAVMAAAALVMESREIDARRSRVG